MSEWTDVPEKRDQSASNVPSAKPAVQQKGVSTARGADPSTNTPPSDDYDEIPVEELVRLTRELTQRITNADRQRLAEELQSSGHQRTIQTKGPLTLQQFFTGEIDLDSELAHRFANAPLLSSMSVNPRKVTSLTRRVSAILTSQDGGAMITFDVELQTGRLEVTFTLGSMLSFRFDLGFIEKSDRQRWIDLMRRNSGIAFLWTKERWENDYMIWVVREYFARLYAFSPKRFEAAVRMTPDMIEKVINWFEAYWLHNQGEEETRVRKPNKRLLEKAKQQAAAASTKDTAPLDKDKAPPAPSDVEETASTPEEAKIDEEPLPSEEDSTESDASKFEW